MAKPQTYEEFLKATGQPDSEAAKRSYGNAAMTQAGAGITPPVTPKAPAAKPDAPAIPKNPLQVTAETLLGRPVESQTEMANRLGWPNSPDTAKRYNAAIQAMIDAKNTDTAAQHRSGAYIGQNAQQAGPAVAAAPPVESVAPALPIESVPIPAVADKPAEVVTQSGPKQEDRDKMAWLGKTLAGLAGGLGDAFSARAAAMQGREFTPTRTLQRQQIEAQTKEGAANRAETAKLHAESLAAQQELARLSAKATLTAAEVDRKAAMERLLLENKARLEAAGLQAGIIPQGLRSTMPQKDPLGVR